MASVWFKNYDLKDFKQVVASTMIEHVGIEFTEIGDHFLCGKMPIDNRTIQPMGTLHGGASLAFAETLASVASFMIIDPEKQICVGQALQANFVRPGIKGFVYGKASLIHKGSTTHIWNVDIINEEGKLVCACRQTMAIIDKNKNA